ncbi:uncharacterized protein LOC122650686 [Telopea speciosissima]|uniref:uncharacterized protein LOC122650686 n=1 Tax=Telopea speciosissima TaxID=54955 RepID=UPI001CC4BD79|nr:uncharacterized protein LOC122650686 [Telopea speciosissima]
MDWLSAYGTNVMCVEKQILLRTKDGAEFTYKSKRTKIAISALQPWKLLDDGCHGYLATVIDTEAKTKPLVELEVVTEVPNMFPDDLTQLPPDWETEFGIDLIPRAALVSKPPHKMAPMELKELQIQLQDFLKKGHIRPSVSESTYALCEKERWKYVHVHQLSRVE